MLFKTIISVTVAATSALAAPLEVRCPGCPSRSLITPSSTWQYSVKDGAISSTSTIVEVYKAPGNGGKDQTALVTFTYPVAAKGKQCQFEFYLPASASPAGSKKLDVFSSNKPAPGPTSGGSPGNQRNSHLGRLSVVPGAAATWDSTQGSYLTTKVPCKEPNTVEAFELVGVYDFDSINWNPSSGDGLRIVYSS
ncbi:hypothetical protein B0J13DRAFT_659831 [Dactylonectria estremocensis]|uniref:Ubiquitin 3 binding protein But2 C-terminal domain-containing protein n=1 Tax=Dactylonectria estremocensis TaxID=1079267 RepID=A0A9P9D2U2_9HYPO|nr:hypothetical protein B0J13DRAFT_659831 [Dactylonectria estremocensis]